MPRHRPDRNEIEYFDRSKVFTTFEDGGRAVAEQHGPGNCMPALSSTAFRSEGFLTFLSTPGEVRPCSFFA
jgi:hypothetical protein